jgi:AbrB family looped-hinge helix DNA binding protein
MIKVTGDLTMSSASANPKGRIKIPAEARKKLDLNSGDRVGFIENENGEFVHRPKTGSIMNLKGIVKWTGKPVTVEEMDKAISEHHADFPTLSARSSAPSWPTSCAAS